MIYIKKLFKSKERVREHGEIFTPDFTVRAMLNDKEVLKKISIPESTFFEPSAGEGAFLMEILSLKLNNALVNSKSVTEYENSMLLALSTLYGIELLQDNFIKLKFNLITLFSEMYSDGLKRKWNENPNYKVISSANTIINANLKQGNALTRKDDEGNSIFFSEWKIIGEKRTKVQRSDFTLESIINEESDDFNVEYEEMDLFSDYNFFNEQENIKAYKVVKWRNIYKEELL